MAFLELPFALSLSFSNACANVSEPRKATMASRHEPCSWTDCVECYSASRLIRIPAVLWCCDETIRRCLSASSDYPALASKHRKSIGHRACHRPPLLRLPSQLEACNEYILAMRMTKGFEYHLPQNTGTLNEAAKSGLSRMARAEDHYHLEYVRHHC